MKKRILLIIFTAIIIAGFGYYVFAGPAIGEGDGGSNNSGTGEAVYGSYSNGVRLSFVDSKGKHIGGKNFVGHSSQDANLNIKKNKFLISNNSLSKIAYISSGRNPKISPGGDGKRLNSSSGYSSLDGLSKLFTYDNVTILSDDDVKTFLNDNAEPEKIIESFENIGGDDDTKSKIAEGVFNNLLKEFGVSKELKDFLVPSSGDPNTKVYDIFLVIEPTHAIDYAGKGYYGSYYELVNTADENYLTAQGSYMSFEFPCILKLNGNLKKYLGIEKLDNGKMLPLAFNNFTANNYFVKINVSNKMIDDANYVCSKDAKDNILFGKEKLRGGNILGLGLVWPSMYVTTEDDPATCDEVIEFYDKEPNKVNLAEMTYDQITKFDFAKWNNDENNRFRQINSEWYIKNNCPMIKPSCDDINNFYGTDLSKKTQKQLLKFDFSEWNEENPSNKITGQQYIDMCGFNEKEDYNCTPQFGFAGCALPGEEPSDSKLFYSDTPEINIPLDDNEFWNNCVFNDDGYYDKEPHKFSDKNNPYTYFDPELGQFCTEKVTATFPNSPKNTIEAGRYFVWGAKNEVFVTGERVCKTESVDYEDAQFEIKKHNDKIKEAYSLYELEKAKKKEFDKLKNNPKDYIYEDEFYCEGDKCEECHISGEEKPCNTDGYIIKGDNGLNNTNDSPNFHKDFNLKWPVLGNNIKNKYTPEIDVATAEANYINEKNATKFIIDKINGNANKPVEIDIKKAENSFKLEPNISMLYGDNNKYTTYQTDGIPMIGETSVNSETLNSSNNEGKELNLNVIDSCSNGKCHSKQIKVKEHSSKGVKITKSMSFSLPDDIYRYISKSSGLSIDNSDSENIDNLNYIDVGFSNFPVSFSAKNGTYGKNQEKGGALSIVYSDLGHKGPNGAIFDAIGAEHNSSLYGNWDCAFKVLELPDKIFDNVIYREIDLKNPFPGMDGNGRNTGANWCDAGNCSNTNSIVSEAILNNRGVSSNEVYKKEPIYSIVLTPKKLSQIKKYNKSHNYYDFSKDSIVCEEGTGRACISNYLRSLGVSGTCASVSEPKPEEFENCRK